MTRNAGGKDKKDEDERKDAEGLGPRFKKGSEDLDQLEGIEKQQQRTRKAQKKQEQDGGVNVADPAKNYPLIDDIEKSRKRVKNRFRGIKNSGDAVNEFGS